MANWLTNTIGGAAGDFESWWNGGTAAQATGDTLDAKLTAMNNADYAPGGRIYNQIAAASGQSAADQAWASVQADLGAGATGNVSEQIVQAGQAGAAAGLNNLAAGVQSATSGIFDSLFKIIPWQAWLIAGLALFVWLGGLVWLKGSLSK
ncbi:MAG: hypothetical protein KGJ60_13875 [Verrucomicrobiota bacterium]|nr:hypothetical protein [Verrucomicrobiota bacterium]